MVHGMQSCFQFSREGVDYSYTVTYLFTRQIHFLYRFSKAIEIFINRTGLTIYLMIFLTSYFNIQCIFT